MKMHLLLVFLVSFLSAPRLHSQHLAVLHYEGGGDWYANPTSLPNLSAFYNREWDAQTTVLSEVRPLDLLDQFPIFVHATGHGRIYFSEDEQDALRNYLLAGGFLHIDDNYGMAAYATTVLQELFPRDRFPNAEVKEVATAHAIFRLPYRFENGLPKIHEHDNKIPSALGLFLSGELVALLTTECDLGDGWEDAQVHNDPQEIRKQALQMGANLVHWALLRAE